MAEVVELKKLNRTQLNELAVSKGVANPEQYETKGDVAEQLSPLLTPEELTAYIDSQKAGGSSEQVNEGDDTNTPTEQPKSSQNASKTFERNQFVLVRRGKQWKRGQVVRVTDRGVNVTVEGNPEVLAVFSDDVKAE